MSTLFLNQLDKLIHLCLKFIFIFVQPTTAQFTFAQAVTVHVFTLHSYHFTYAALTEPILSTLAFSTLSL